jgi:diadenosine tetraphosphatase ApaH/serine/threonine PP2A family protein phosphatase
VRYAILSDVHANRDALDRVLTDLPPASIDRVLCLGDFVGYGPQPNECVDRLREVAAPALAGNHDLAAIGALDPVGFNLFARLAVEWTRATLTESSRRYLEALPGRVEFEGMLLVHGSPRQPVHEYLLDLEAADDNFETVPFSICFFGHSHYPIWFVHDGIRTRMRSLPPNQPVQLESGYRHMVNVGSVGQPRDGDPRAAFVVYDTENRTVELRRLTYPVESVQAKMQAAGLPRPLWERLAEGR